MNSLMQIWILSFSEVELADKKRIEVENLVNSNRSCLIQADNYAKREWISFIYLVYAANEVHMI